MAGQEGRQAGCHAAGIVHLQQMGRLGQHERLGGPLGTASSAFSSRLSVCTKRSVLSQRLRLLERAGVVQRTQTGRSTWYALTPSGHELAQVCLELGAWGARWRGVRPEDQDPYLALWMLSRMIDPNTLARKRMVVQFHITGRPAPNRFWLVCPGPATRFAPKRRASPRTAR
jgi:hypothetical protein